MHPTWWHGVEKVACLTGAAQEDRCAWNICLFYHLGWYCIVRLKSHYPHQIMLEDGLSKKSNNNTMLLTFTIKMSRKNTFMTGHLFLDGKSSQRYNIWTMETGFWTMNLYEKQTYLLVMFAQASDLSVFHTHSREYIKIPSYLFS